VAGVVNGDSQDGQDQSLATSDRRRQAPSPPAVSASMADKGLGRSEEASEHPEQHIHIKRNQSQQ